MTIIETANDCVGTSTHSYHNNYYPQLQVPFAGGFQFHSQYIGPGPAPVPHGTSIVQLGHELATKSTNEQLQHETQTQIYSDDNNTLFSPNTSGVQDQSFTSSLELLATTAAGNPTRESSSTMNTTTADLQVHDPSSNATNQHDTGNHPSSSTDATSNQVQDLQPSENPNPTQAENSEEDSIDYKSIVSKREWYNTIQEVCKETTSNSYFIQFRKLWEMSNKYYEVWKKNKWEHAIRLSRGGNFKKKLVEKIVEQRELVSKSDFRSITDLLTEQNKNLRGRQIMVYVKEEFEKYAWENWRVDRKKQASQIKPTSNDTIRFFHVAAIDVHREDLTYLTRGKATKRSDLDGSEKKEKEIIRRWAEVFADESKIFEIPEQIRGNEDFEALNPNDLSRIRIQRDAAFFESLYKKTMSEFKVAVKKWTSDTGGGSGNPLHMHKWDLTSLDEFANYGGGKGCAVRKVWLTYLLILDIKTSYGFSASFNPPPADTILEDGGTSTSETSNNKTIAGGEGDIKLLCSTVDGSMKYVAKAMVAASTPPPEPKLTTREKRRLARRQELEDLDSATSLQNKLEKQRMNLLALPDEDPDKHRKLYVNRKALRKAANIAEEITNEAEESSSSESGESESSDDDSTFSSIQG